MSEYGWNDPPSFSYNSLQTGATKRTQLTKRVNHEISTPSQTLSKPLSTVATTCVSHTIPGPPTEAKSNPHPPPLQSETANPPESIINQSELRTESSTDSVQCFDTVIENLGNVVKKHSESMQMRTRDEIKRRVQLLADQWRSGKLSAHVQAQMTKLTAALESEDYITADTIHISLMVDHVSEVSQWMVGVKRLIATLKQQQQQQKT